MFDLLCTKCETIHSMQDILNVKISTGHSITDKGHELEPTHKLRMFDFGQ